MRQGISGLLFMVAAALLGLAAGAWVMQRVAFEPATSRGAAVAIFEHEDLKNAVATSVATATSERLQRPVDQGAVAINSNFLAMLYDAGARSVLNQIVTDAQATMLGQRSGPVEVSPISMIQIVRTEEVADIAPATIGVGKIGWLALLRTVTVWTTLVAGGLGVVALVLGILARPTRGDLIFGLGVLCVSVALFGFLLGYLVPAFLIPFLTKNPWAAIFEEAAADQLPLVGGLAAVLAIVGAALALSTVGTRRRKSRNWSSPVRPTRYNTEQRQWSR